VNLDLDAVHPYRPYYDRQGRPISLRRWAEFRDQDSYVRVAEDHLDDDHIWVSTVWLGINHSFGDGPPLIFETMVFVHLTEEQLEERRWRWTVALRRPMTDFPWEDLECWRYHTEAEARRGHRSAVMSLKLRIEVFEGLEL
jgi:hypothetical protein